MDTVEFTTADCSACSARAGKDIDQLRADLAETRTRRVAERTDATDQDSARRELGEGMREERSA